ncbi:unnamed protein product, partial [Brassica rapa subsp. narinosa]
WFEIAGGDKKRGGGSLAPSAMAVQSERFVYLQQNKRSMDIAKARKKREKLGIYVPRLARVSLSVEGIALGALAPWRQKRLLFRTKILRPCRVI